MCVNQANVDVYSYILLEKKEKYECGQVSKIGLSQLETISKKDI